MIPSVLLLLCLEGRDRAVPTRQNVLGGLGTFRSLCLFFFFRKQKRTSGPLQTGAAARRAETRALPKTARGGFAKKCTRTSSRQTKSNKKQKKLSLHQLVFENNKKLG